MKPITHREIDRRIHAMVVLCVDKIDADAALLKKVLDNATRIADPRIRNEWLRLLTLPWVQVREELLARTAAADQLRQNAPLGGLLSNAERFQFFKTGDQGMS